ncbi:sulfotransferase [Paraburkholderia nemoris]|uniref:sulfotransferase family protein n=1 Tax=Paraburkholderia nemoris TaxID=2793076 RepID=UPI0038B7D5D9
MKLFGRARAVSETLQSRSEVFTPVFVGGAPRSGTTVLHAIICSSEKANDYIAECSYFTALLQPLATGLNVFDAHTRYYFDSREELITHHGKMLERELLRFWSRLGKPQVLALKDPMLTQFFAIAAQALPKARFVLSARDPRDTILSRIEVAQKQTGTTTIAEATIAEFCAEYVRLYRSVLDHQVVFDDRLCIVNYQDLVEGKANRVLEEFGCGRVSADRVWTRDANPSAFTVDEWATELHGTRPSTASVARFKSRLQPRAEELIMSMCGEVARELGVIA